MKCIKGTWPQNPSQQSRGIWRSACSVDNWQHSFLGVERSHPFLSTFVLLSQNRFSDAADGRAELDVYIGLLAEHAITRVLQISMRLLSLVGVGTDVATALAGVGALGGHVLRALSM
jgi:hypothetical protein